ncbi:phosphatidylserine/phosphatidylglycerophosphate/cardiolipin synthase-like enzyme [Halospina denitrificans]|uniref:Phosphatidylserine/phosphatidylglycerophosphate/ cardiolipin synthase-like enzyme n=1 Tax=Halospina denitrificans TaxID=332522 RepID=A0A4R7K1U8_9GAMM|nr:phospholipase D-like domain-containing protein [Halospina denitrificans]TDT44555.1 phosphatidylserine/phosphatidylglycerophosphate/cardiolipin synthase-like enzyme [Halospina denitrificans]
MNKAMASWKKEDSETIDQRNFTLPPTWTPASESRFAPVESINDVFSSGPERQLARKFISFSESADQMIVLSSFLLADREIEDALLAAANRGIRVYVMLASEARLENDDSEEPFDKHVIDQHKEMLARLSGHVLFRSAPHFHAKVLLIDPFDAGSSGILLTANLTEAALERNPELAVELTSAEVEQVSNLLRWAMWETAEHEKLGPEEQFRPVKPLGMVDYPELANGIVATTEQEQSIHECAMSVIDSAMDKLLVSSFGWDLNHPVVQRLCERAQEGVKITILARKRAASMPALLALRRAGATVIGYKWLHAKAIWADSDRAVITSANLQTQGLDKGFEVGVHLSDTRSEWLKYHLESWVAQAPKSLQIAPLLGSLIGKVEVWDQPQFKEVEISEEENINLGKHECESAEDLEYRPEFPAGPSIPTAHQRYYRWEVTAPQLKPKSKPEHRKEKNKSRQSTPYALPVFREPDGRRVVAIRTRDQLQEALSVKVQVQADAIVVDSGAEG